MRKALPVEVGEKYGKLTVIEKLEGTWLKCKCDCGNITYCTSSRLKPGNTKSCGCLQKATLIQRNIERTKHGAKALRAAERLYGIWGKMKERCYRPENHAYKDYGGRGIKVCDEWINDYVAFKEWAMSTGYADSLTLDRIDNNGNYCPGNCRWATAKEQANNRRNSRRIEYDGLDLTVSEWSDKTGIPYKKIYRKYFERGMSAKEALTP